MMSSATSMVLANSSLYGVSCRPSGVSVTYSVSPLPIFSLPRSSLGRTMPVELPTVVTFTLYAMDVDYNECYKTAMASRLEMAGHWNHDGVWATNPWSCLRSPGGRCRRILPGGG